MAADSREYFERRERAERAAAKKAASAQVRRIHQDLARRYATLARTGAVLTQSKIYDAAH
jgi:hypothetical protein